MILNKHLPEQRLYLRTDSSTRFLRLTPGVQATVIAVSAVFFVWTILVSSMFLVDTFAPSSDAAVVRIQQLDFETRLTRLSSERDKRALETQKAQERFYVALDQISSQQSALLRSEDRRREVETGLEVVQRALRKTVKERDRAEIHADTLLAELQSVTGNVSTVSSAAEENGVTLDFLNSALETTVRERDDMA
ncbi:MAG TPA: peptidase M23, partial [Rhodobacteraceae bacterium]|nr:peptidase M23 [Paracoccaceae bacterium]